MAYAGGVFGGLNPPPRTGKYCCRKMMLLPKFLFLATNFPKNRYKFNFSIELSAKSFKISPTNCVFRPNARKINAWFVKSFEKDVKIMDCSKFSKYIF